MKLLWVGALLLCACGDSSPAAQQPDLARKLTFGEVDMAVAGDGDMATIPGTDMATTVTPGADMATLPGTDMATAVTPGADMTAAPNADMAGANPNLIVYLTFDSVSGTTVHDSSGHNNDGTLQGDATVAGGGKTGNALSLTGTKANTDVALGDVAPFSGAVTIEAWVKPSGAQTAWAQVISRWSDGAGGYWLGGSSPSGNFAFFIAQGGGTSNGALQPNAWQHIAATFKSAGTTGEMFINGVHDSGGTLPNTGPGPGTLVVGGNQGADASNFVGLVDEVRIYSVVRTQAEICSDAGGTPGGGATCTLP